MLQKYIGIFLKYKHTFILKMLPVWSNWQFRCLGHGKHCCSCRKLKFDLQSEKFIVHTLTDVLHNPSAPSCLLSIPRFTDSVYGHAIFKKIKILLLYGRNNLLGTRKKVKGLYHMQVEISPQHTAAVAHSGLKAFVDVWHQHFVHISVSGLIFCIQIKCLQALMWTPEPWQCLTAPRVQCRSLPKHWAHR